MFLKFIFSLRAVGAFYRLEGHQFTVKAERCGGPGAEPLEKFLRHALFYFGNALL